MYRGILFDFDGTLYFNNGFGRRLVLNHLEMRENLAALREVRKNLPGKEFSDGSTYKQYLFAGMADILSSRSPHRPPVNAATTGRWYHHDYYPAVIDTLDRHSSTAELSGEILTKLASRYVLGLYSDIGVVDERLRAVGISPTLFGARACADETGLHKPSKRVFSHMAGRMRLKSSEILVVGDDPEIDGSGAQAAGMDFFLIVTSQGEAGFSESWKRLERMLLN